MAERSMAAGPMARVAQPPMARADRRPPLLTRRRAVASLRHRSLVLPLSMPTILDQIVADTRALLARRKRQTPLDALRDRAGYHAPTLSLERALRGAAKLGGDGLPGPAVIAEIKPASPSKGRLRSELDVARIARSYKSARAAAISVLTEPVHFKGSLGNLQKARHACDLPLLRKDFVMDAYQLHEARAYGADAVLLIAAILEKDELAALHAEATELGLSCLVEVYDQEEMEKLDFRQIRILGVNNRDLRTFAVDLGHSLRVFDEAPDHVVRVSESGIRTGADVAHLVSRGVHGVLVGEAFMRAEDPGCALRRLRREATAGLVPTA